jgi:hypothetical protein
LQTPWQKPGRFAWYAMYAGYSFCAIDFRDGAFHEWCEENYSEIREYIASPYWCDGFGHRFLFDHAEARQVEGR